MLDAANYLGHIIWIIFILMFTFYGKLKINKKEVNSKLIRLICAPFLLLATGVVFWLAGLTATAIFAPLSTWF